MFTSPTRGKDTGDGNDVLNGGAGPDTMFYIYSDRPTTVNLEKGTVFGDGRDRVANTEGVNAEGLVIGSDGNDRITVWGGTAKGRAGDDYVAGWGYLYGGEGDDKLNPLITEGEATAIGGEGSDWLWWTAMDIQWNNIDLAHGEAWLGTRDNGFARLRSIENAASSSYPHESYLWGGPGPNHLVGGPGPDHLYGFGGDDILDGDPESVPPYPPPPDTPPEDTADGGDGSDSCLDIEQPINCEGP
jgi:Ca2+-binding RTX toxin-like protein